MRAASEPATREILRHWQEAVPNDRLAHLVKHAAPGFARALQMRLTEHSVSYGHWTFLRILWESEGLTQRQLSGQAGVMEPTTFSALNAMEKLGYVMRQPNPTSRKEVHVYLTPQGTGLEEQARSIGRGGERGRVCRTSLPRTSPRRAGRSLAIHCEPGGRRDGIAHAAPAHPVDAGAIAAAQRGGAAVRKSLPRQRAGRRQVSVNPP